ncbi:MAG: hypothetical protein AAGU75_20125, partial [Bacillota bacterium]
VFNLAPDGKLGSYVGNTVGSYKNLCILTGGKSANYSFHDRSGNFLKLKNGAITEKYSFPFIMKNIENDQMI